MAKRYKANEVINMIADGTEYFFDGSDDELGEIIDSSDEEKPSTYDSVYDSTEPDENAIPYRSFFLVLTFPG